ncbi:hypothetical protein AQUCO_01700345v1 [Aquilegia coerulea]|uniref:Histidine-containing phosphotransfer protein n=1 Tax=Aquilegia coerulea TaxID=218851 RepID=A0A2G5DMD0_AQUCA|nr:hypothetical protein AQUCO_01700345v1 [Aquilegia coerulea]PIA44679.1 hypothetical protein AQUCO_01700345v1 [Aquilegia coerulea]
MDFKQLQIGWVKYMNKLVEDGILDEQYKQLQQLQDESTPNFVLEVVSLFFDDSQKIIYELERALAQPIVDYKIIDAYVHQLKGSSSSVGAGKVKEVCVKFRESCENQNKEGWSNRYWQLVDLSQQLCYPNNDAMSSRGVCSKVIQCMQKEE